MADIDDRDALALQPADQREELVGFGAGQVGRRLVEDQELRAAHGGAGGRDELLLADGQVAEQRVGRQVEAEIVEDRLRLAVTISRLRSRPKRVVSSPRKMLAATVRCGHSTTS